MSRPLHSEPTRPKELWRVFPSGSCQAQRDVDVHVGCATHAQLSRCVQSSHSVTGRSPTRGLRKFCEYKPLLYNGSYSKNVGSETGNRTKQSLVSFGDRGLPTQRERRPNELWRRFLRRGGQSAAQEETTDQRRQAGRCEREGGVGEPVTGSARCCRSTVSRTGAVDWVTRQHAFWPRPRIQVRNPSEASDTAASVRTGSPGLRSRG